MALDFHDPKVRRQLCTGLVELFNQHGPKGKDIVELAEQTPSLTQEEREVIKDYFSLSRTVGQL